MSGVSKKRLTPKEWAEATALWESGEVTSKDLSDKFGVSRETFLRRFKKDGIEKGVRAHEHADAVREELSKSLSPDQVLTAQRAKETKEQHYNWSAALARMAMNEIAVAARDKVPVASKLPNLKAIEKAAAILEKARNERWIVLGLDKNDDFDDEMPELAIVVQILHIGIDNVSTFECLARFVSTFHHAPGLEIAQLDAHERLPLSGFDELVLDD